MEVAVNEVTASSVSLLGVSNSKYAPTVTSDLAFFLQFDNVHVYALTRHLHK